MTEITVDRPVNREQEAEIDAQEISALEEWKREIERRLIVLEDRMAHILGKKQEQKS